MYFLVEGLLYNSVVVFDIHQLELAIGKHMSLPLKPTSLPIASL